MKKKFIAFSLVITFFVIIIIKFYSTVKTITEMPIDLSSSKTYEGVIHYFKPNSYFMLYIELDKPVKDEDELCRELENLKVKITISNANETYFVREVYIIYNNGFDISEAKKYFVDDVDLNDYNNISDKNILTIDPGWPIQIPKGVYKLSITSEKGIDSLAGIKQILTGRYIYMDQEMTEIFLLWFPLFIVSIILFVITVVQSKKSKMKFEDLQLE